MLIYTAKNNKIYCSFGIISPIKKFLTPVCDCNNKANPFFEVLLEKIITESNEKMVLPWKHDQRDNR